MEARLTFLSRHQINDAEWDRCVGEAHNALLYGHSWYLDAVTNVPDSGRGNVPTWRWEGLVQFNEAGDGYVAVLPVPLRRRWGRWVVYQPLFCQFLAIFSAQPVDFAPFLGALTARYRYATRLCLLFPSPLSNVPAYMHQQLLYTHTLAIDGAETDASAVSTRYTADRRLNLRRAHRRVAQTPGWQVVESTNIQPLLALFRDNHAEKIGAGEWAHELFEQVYRAIQSRGLGTLRYACIGDVPMAGVLFAEQHGRIIYLFNAANTEGRRLNARTLLLNEALQNAAARPMTTGLLFDFESPEKPGICQFYESFGAEPTPYLQLSWSQLTRIERWLQRLKTRLQQSNG